MQQHLIPAEEFCTHHHIEVSFVNTLSDHGLLEIVHQQNRYYIDSEHLHQLEKLMHLHYDLHINMEGLEAIAHMLHRVENLHTQLQNLQCKLKFYENHSPIETYSE